MSVESYMPFGSVKTDISGATNWAEVVQMVPSLGVEVGFEPAHYVDPASGEHRVLDSYKIPVDSESRQPLGGNGGTIVGAGFSPIQNSVQGAFLQTFVDEGLANYSVAATMDEGMQTLIELDIPNGNFSITRGNGEEDEYAGRISMRNAHNGTYSWTGGSLTHRLFCMNQLPALRKNGNVFSFRHSRYVNDRVGMAHRVIASALEQLQGEQENLQALANYRMNQTQFIEFVLRLITEQPDLADAKALYLEAEEKGGKSLGTLNRKLQTLDSLFRQGQGNNGSDALDALNAVTEYADWCHGSRDAEDFHVARVVRGEIIQRMQESTPTPQRQQRSNLAALVTGETVEESTEQSEPVASVDNLIHDERRRDERRLQSALSGAALKMKQRARDLLLEDVALAA